MSRVRWYPRPVIRLEPGEMNKTERRYARHLEGLKYAGEIEGYVFEGMTFTLVHNVPERRNGMIYRPDFLVITREAVELHEVKAFSKTTGKALVRDDAKDKIKMAAEMFPWFRWIMVWEENGRWQKEEF